MRLRGRVLPLNTLIPNTVREDIFKEIEILMKVDHPNVMYMKECFIASDKVQYTLVGCLHTYSLAN